MKKLTIPGLGINKYEWLAEMMKSDLKPAAKQRAFAIYTFTDERGLAWPNQLNIEMAIGSKSISRTSQYITQLQKAGWIQIEKRKIDAMKFSNCYRLTLPNTREARY